MWPLSTERLSVDRTAKDHLAIYQELVHSAQMSAV